ncbi:MAG: hypothetical protein ACRDUA_25335 [Micromonosporaceae bacterium]
MNPMNGLAPLGLAPLESTTVQMGGHRVSVVQPHRRWTATDYVLGAAESTEYEPVAVTVTAPVRLSLEDVAGVLFYLGLGDGEDFTDDNHVRFLVAETVVHGGSGLVEEVRCGIGERTLGTAHAAYLAYCRDRAAAVFAPRPGEQPHRHEFAAAAR